MAIELAYKKVVYKINNEEVEVYVDMENVDDSYKFQASVSFAINGYYYYEADLEMSDSDCGESLNIELTNKEMYILDSTTEKEFSLEEKNKMLFDKFFNNLKEFIQDEIPFSGVPLQLEDSKIEEFIRDELVEVLDNITG